MLSASLESAVDDANDDIDQSQYSCNTSYVLRILCLFLNDYSFNSHIKLNKQVFLSSDFKNEKLMA